MRTAIAIAVLSIAQVGTDAQIAALQERLKANANDPVANLALGKIQFFERGLWNPGLFHLAQGNDKHLRQLSQRDLAQPDMVEERVAIGDAWWDLAEKEKADVQRNLRVRAAHWYRLALPDTFGLRRGRLEGRIRLTEAKSEPAAK